jgi:hypothetical protein
MMANQDATCTAAQVVRNARAGAVSATVSEVINHPDVVKAMETAEAGGTDFLTILAAILPLILGLFSGGTTNFSALIAAVIAAINGLITPPAPAQKTKP